MEAPRYDDLMEVNGCCVVYRVDDLHVWGEEAVSGNDAFQFNAEGGSLQRVDL
jgi:hypothetical protein